MIATVVALALISVTAVTALVVTVSLCIVAFTILRIMLGIVIGERRW